jgi:hypothetical protein
MSRATLAGAAALLLLANPSSAQDRSPFQGLSGIWEGTGTVTLSSGNKERIRCQAEYAVGGSGSRLQQKLRCESPSYKFDLSSDVAYQGGTISGNWTERTRHTGGTVSGSVIEGGRIQAVVDGQGFSAVLNLVTRGDRQSVQMESKGEKLNQVSIMLRRA